MLNSIIFDIIIKKEPIYMEQEMPDLLWKEIIEDLFEDFIEFFLPELYKEIDFNEGYEFLDQELANIVDKTLKGKKMSDRLVKVYLKDGRENWILAHLEVQGYKEDKFEERMFKYFYRIYDKYNQKIVALSIFTEGNKDYKPDDFKYDLHGTKLDYQYNVYKILEQSEEDLLNSDNPFAMVVLAGLYSLKSKNEEQKKYKFKIKLLRLLLNKGYKNDKVYNIFEFLDGILFLPTDLEIKFQENIEEITGGDDMGVSKEMTNLYQAGMEKNKIKVAKKLLEKNMSLEEISEVTELSKEEIKNIKEKSQH